MMPEGDEQVVARREIDAPERSLGRALREARERQQLSLEQIAADLRIEPHLLEALEQDRLADLGAPVFAKGYLKQYGQRLGLRYEDLLSSYYDQVEPQDMPIAPSRSIKLRDERQILMWLISGLALALLAVLLFVWWVNEPQGTGLFGRSPVPAAGQSTAPIAATVPSRAQSPLPASAPPGAGPSGAPLTAKADATSSGDQARSSSNAATSGPQTRSGTPLEQQTRVASADSGAPADRIRIQLRFDADSWTEITDGNGERLYYGLARAGAQSSFDAVAPVAVLLGNADGVHLRVDGHQHPIPQAVRQGNVARFTLGSAASAN